MPLFGRKKSEKSRPKSQFFDTPISETTKPAQAPIHIDNSSKRRSKSKFYEDIPSAPQTTDSFDTESIASTNSHGSINSKPSQPSQEPPKILAIETQGDLGEKQGSTEWNRRTSILSRSFADILCDKELITYFIQYMSSKDKGHLVRFWLDSENFTQASLSRMRAHSMHSAIDESSRTNNSPNPHSTAPSEDRTQHGKTADVKTAGSLRTSQDDLQERIKDDAVNIYSRYIALDCQSSIGISEELRNSTISKICSEDGKVDPQCFRDCQKFTEDLLQKEYFKEFLESSFYRKYQIDMLTSNRLHLIDILYNDNIMFYFMEFIEQEQASRMLQFWMAVDNFQTHLESDNDNYPTQDAQSDAMIIYEKYFSLQASEPLGFTDKVRMHVELNICREEGPLPDCFLIPKIIILETIERTLLTQFLQSQIYFRFLSELINSVQANHHQHDTPKTASKRSHTRTGSNASFDTHSLGGQNGGQDGKVSSASSASELNHNKIDEDQPLWKRVHQRNAMSLGHLSEFGQYISELDIEQVPDLDKKKGNRFSRKKKEKEKAQEDMAWQIAKMIIDDINREVTSSQSRNETMSETAESTTSGAESGIGDQGESTNL